LRKKRVWVHFGRFFNPVTLAEVQRPRKTFPLFPLLLVRHGDDVPLRHVQRRRVAVRVARVLEQDLVVLGTFGSKKFFLIEKGFFLLFVLPRPGTDVRIYKNISSKNVAKKVGFFLLKLLLVFEKM
jgi:hypothetical protein